MPKAFDSIASDINEILRKTGGSIISITWRDFYSLCERDRLKEVTLKRIADDASNQFQLIVAYGRNAVIVCHDRNFNPPASHHGRTDD